MLTPEEVAGHAFSKAAFGGYNMAMVDEFLDELTDDYTALYRENAALKAKMKVLVDKVEEYRATEDSMRAALLTAQKMASSMVSEAEERKETLLADAEMEARAKIGALHDEIVFEQKRLNAVKDATREFVERTRRVCEEQIRLLEAIPDLTPEEIGRTTTEVKAARDEAADIAAIGEKILASFKQEEAGAEENMAVTTLISAVRKPERAEEPVEAEKDLFADVSTRTIKLSELKFGRNYHADEEG